MEQYYVHIGFGTRYHLDHRYIKRKNGSTLAYIMVFHFRCNRGSRMLSAMILGLDYEYHAVLIGYFLYIFHKKPVWAIPFCFLAMYKEPWALLGFGLTYI